MRTQNQIVTSIAEKIRKKEEEAEENKGGFEKKRDKKEMAKKTHDHKKVLNLSHKKKASAKVNLSEEENKSETKSDIAEDQKLLMNIMKKYQNNSSS